MHLRYLSVLSALVCVPSIALSDDSFIYTRESAPKMMVGVPDTADATAQYYEQIEQAQQEQRQQEQMQREQMQKSNNQYSSARGGIQNYAQQDSAVPETPSGWDSLTTGTANGGGVLGSQGGHGGFGGVNGNATGLLGGNVNARIMNSGLPQNILSGLSTQDASGGILGGSVEESDGVSSARERAMYGAFLSALLKFVQSQPDTAPIASVGGPSYGATQAYTAVPARGAARSAMASRPAAAVTNGAVPARGNTQTPQPWK